MKKVIFALVIATSLVARGGNAYTEATATHSAAVAADTTAVVDSTVAPVADTTATK